MMTVPQLQAYLDNTIEAAEKTIARLTEEMAFDAFTVLSMRGDDLSRAAAEIHVLTRWQSLLGNGVTVEQIKAVALDQILSLSVAIAERPTSSPTGRVVQVQTLAVWTDLYKRIG